MTQLETAARPGPAEFGPFFANYIERVPPGDIIELMDEQISEVCELASQLSDQAANQLHPPYTWTIKQVYGHLIDCERVFGYRAARFAAGDQTPLASFDENRMVAEMEYTSVGLECLTEEWRSLRRANLLFFRRLTSEQWRRRGISSNNELSVRAVAFILVGHAIHHLSIIRQRLGLNT